ncbi:MAG: hypothetical protein AB7S42_11525 [Lysobacteraceae bacterium]
MPIWSEWVTFILGALATLIAIGGAWLGWQRRRQPLRIGFSVQPYKLGGHRIGNGPPAPRELLQLDITNTGSHPLVITGARMRLRGEAGEHSVFNEATGEGWITGKPVEPGQTVFVKCSASNEGVLPRIERVSVTVHGLRPVHLGGRTVRRAVQALGVARGG